MDNIDWLIVELIVGIAIIVTYRTMAIMTVLNDDEDDEHI